MGVAPVKALSESTVTVLERDHEKLLRESEQLRILKNYCRLEEVITKGCIETLIKAMEGKNE